VIGGVDRPRDGEVRVVPGRIFDYRADWPAIPSLAACGHRDRIEMRRHIDDR
jgi:hypothetical protein